jgi:ribosomal-protein-alanine N-acetyltransferase
MPVAEAFTQLPTFMTDRLRIRPLEEADAEAIFTFKGDPNVTERYGQEPHQSLDETRQWIENRLVGYQKHDSMFWVFTFKDDSTAIGSCCFWNFDHDSHSAELGYELHPAQWHKGMMTEALRPVMDYGFDEMELHRIEACPMSDNTPSRDLLLKLGFKYEGNHRQRHLFRGRFLDLLYYSILREEWESTQMNSA